MTRHALGCSCVAEQSHKRTGTRAAKAPKSEEPRWGSWWCSWQGVLEDVAKRRAETASRAPRPEESKMHKPLSGACLCTWLSQCQCERNTTPSLQICPFRRTSCRSRFQQPQDMEVQHTPYPHRPQTMPHTGYRGGLRSHSCARRCLNPGRRWGTVGQWCPGSLLYPAQRLA